MRSAAEPGAHGDLAHALLERAPVLGEQRDVEIALALEVAVQRALRDAGRERHLVEIGGHEAVAEEDFPRRLEDSRALERLALLAALPVRLRHCPRSDTARTGRC